MPKTISPKELSAQLASGNPPYLLDVRQPEEHAIARIEPSHLIPLQELVQRIDEIPSDRVVVVYCHHGVRSLTGAALIERAGHSTVFSLSGGIDTWSQVIDSNIPRY